MLLNELITELQQLASAGETDDAEVFIFAKTANVYTSADIKSVEWFDKRVVILKADED